MIMMSSALCSSRIQLWEFQLAFSQLVSARSEPETGQPPAQRTRGTPISNEPIQSFQEEE